MRTSLKQLILNNTFFYVVIGFFSAVFLARAYIYFGGDLNLTLGGVTLHHFFYGIVLVIFSGLASFFYYEEKFRMPKLRYFLAWLFGLGVGFITDETSFLITAGQIYTLSQYNSIQNVMAEAAIVIVILFALLLSTLRIYIASKRHR